MNDEPTAEESNLRLVNAHKCDNCNHIRNVHVAYCSYSVICDRWPDKIHAGALGRVGDNTSSLLRYTCDGWEKQQDA